MVIKFAFGHLLKLKWHWLILVLPWRSNEGKIPVFVHWYVYSVSD